MRSSAPNNRAFARIGILTLQNAFFYARIRRAPGRSPVTAPPSVDVPPRFPQPPGYSDFLAMILNLSTSSF